MSLVWPLNSPRAICLAMSACRSVRGHSPASNRFQFVPGVPNTLKRLRSDIDKGKLVPCITPVLSTNSP